MVFTCSHPRHPLGFHKHRLGRHLTDSSHRNAEEESSRIPIQNRLPVSPGRPGVEAGFRGVGGIHREVRSHRAENVWKWDADKYFLDGLEHLQESRGIGWE